MLKGHKWWIVLVWVTILVLVVVSRIDTAIQSSTTLSLAPVTSMIPVQISHDPTGDTEYVVPVGSNSVWVVHPTQHQITVITQSSDGTIHANTQSY